jgi:AbiV family abortive infection protein
VASGMADIEAVLPLIQACLSNAERLLNSAKEIRKPGYNHISYHLAALALEEIGKASMLVPRSSRLSASPQEADEDDDKSTISRWLDDHEKKLFWAIWTIGMSTGKFSVKDFREYQEIARSIHQQRLSSLYVDPTEPTAQVEVSDNELNVLLGMTEARLNIEKITELRNLNPEEQQTLDWFLGVYDDPQLKSFIFSGGSLSKLTEFSGDARKWMSWLYEQVLEGNEKSQKLLEKELNRKPGIQEVNEPKWRLKIRFHTTTHSIRPKPLAVWNERLLWIKLFPTNNKHELLVQFTAPSRLPITDVWQAGLQMSTTFLLALNIATLGYFWWYLPSFTSRYYEEIFDIENKVSVLMNRNPPLAIEWKRHALKEAQLNNAAIVFGHMIKLTPDRGEAYNRYSHALAMLAKNDIFGQFEPNILFELYSALRAALVAYGDWDGTGDTFQAALERVLKEFDGDPGFNAEMLSVAQLASTLNIPNNAVKPITLDEVFKMKACCDLYLFTRARREVSKNWNQAPPLDPEAPPKSESPL